jgi:hypothetical protein
VIANDQELSVTLERIARLQRQLAHLRKVEANSADYHAAVSGFLTEVDRMQLEVREYLSLHPTELAATAQPYGRRFDREALKRRSFDALGRFRSGATDLASRHDRHLEDVFGV